VKLKLVVVERKIELLNVRSDLRSLKRGSVSMDE